MKLSVNIDHIATLRQARKGSEPDLLSGTLEAVKAGADGITFHLREDRRHIQDSDVDLLKKEIRLPLNFECSLYPDIVDKVFETLPYEATFVPEKRKEVTTEGGLNVAANLKKLKKLIPQLKARGIVVSLFIDPEKKQLDAAREAGADAIELHTGKYANLTDPAAKKHELKLITDMADYGKNLKFKVHAGHGLNYENIKAIAAIKSIDEVNIGHSIISRSIFTGMHIAVQEMLSLIKNNT